MYHHQLRKMKYERVDINGEKYYRVPQGDVRHTYACQCCHFYDSQENCLYDGDEFSATCFSKETGSDETFVFMTQSELARENIRKRKEKQRNAQE
jgi:hypothetical protein